MNAGNGAASHVGEKEKPGRVMSDGARGGGKGIRGARAAVPPAEWVVVELVVREVGKVLVSSAWPGG